MHELSIAQSILSIAQKALPENNTGHIIGVNVQVGELSSIEPEALQFAFDAIRPDTILDKATLNLEIVPGKAECQACRTVFHLPHFGEPCPTCHSFSLKLLEGREMKVLSIILEE